MWVKVCSGISYVGNGIVQIGKGLVSAIQSGFGTVHEKIKLLTGKTPHVDKPVIALPAPAPTVQIAQPVAKGESIAVEPTIALNNDDQVRLYPQSLQKKAVPQVSQLPLIKLHEPMVQHLAITQQLRK